MKKAKRSPFFYVGDKYKLMPQLSELMPDNINHYIEPFLGGGSSMINTTAKFYLGNDIDKHVIELHRFLSENANNPEKLIRDLIKKIEKYNLSCSYEGVVVPDGLKKKYIKTYYSVYNKENYNKLKEHYNLNKDKVDELYILLIYGFNHMIRFNNKGDFNLPVGNVDFNKNVYDALINYLNFIKDNKSIKFYSKDYIEFLDGIEYKKDDFVFLDPPYYISLSEYNKLWNEKKEIELYDTLDKLDKKGIKFGLTNLVSHKGKKNTILMRRMAKYNRYFISSNYISFNDNTIKKDSQEVYITNYGRK